KNTLGIWALRVLIIASVYLGCITTAKTAWTLGDIGVGIMAWLNLIAILLLHRKVLTLFNDYGAQRSKGLDPVFDNSKYKFPQMDFGNKEKESENKQYFNALVNKDYFRYAHMSHTIGIKNEADIE